MKPLITRRMIEELIKPGFRGLMVFGKPQNLRTWMEMFGEYLIEMKGKYHHNTNTWEFPWGASLKLCTAESVERKSNGNIFSHVEVDEDIDSKTTELVMTKKRIVL